MFDINPLLRPHLRELKPYSSARDEYMGKMGIFLDANENAFGSATQAAYNRYPDPLQKELKARLAEIRGLRPEQIFIGNGSDEAIDLLIRIFCMPGTDEVLILPPTYGMYKVSASIHDITVNEVSLTRDFELDEGAIEQALHANTKLLFICTPNNPTANCLNQQVIERLLTKTKGLIVVDEAYIDFVPHQSLLPLLDKYPRLVVLQTFSKAWGLANLRLGMAYAHPAIIDMLNKVKPPYNISGFSQKAALNALNRQDQKEKMVSQLIEQRELLRNELEKLTIVQQVYPSDTNFLLVKTTESEFIYQALIKQKIIIRNRSQLPLCAGCLRISIGTEKENKRLVTAMKELTHV